MLPPSPGDTPSCIERRTYPRLRPFLFVHAAARPVPVLAPLRNSVSKRRRTSVADLVPRVGPCGDEGVDRYGEETGQCGVRGATAEPEQAARQQRGDGLCVFHGGGVWGTTCITERKIIARPSIARFGCALAPCHSNNEQKYIVSKYLYTSILVRRIGFFFFFCYFFFFLVDVLVLSYEVIDYFFVSVVGAVWCLWLHVRVQMTV